MSDDRQLLHRFAAERSEAAFGELVHRHLPLVYSAALRQTGGDTHLAQDIAQEVFTVLAHKAPGLSDQVILAGWLHHGTIYAARQILRREHRRRAREQQAVTMNTIQAEPDDTAWQEIRPLLDDALEQLNRTDRDALLLRFFEQQSFVQISTRLGGTEEAARKRTGRALEKLRAILHRRGVMTTAAALSTVISANAVQTIPAGLAATLISGSFSAAGTGTATITLLKIMTATQIKLGLGALAAAGVVTAFVIQHQTQARLQDENQSLQQQLGQVLDGYADLSNRVAGTSDAGQLSGDQLNELARLRGEVGQLRKQTNEIDRLQQALSTEQQKADALSQAQQNNTATNNERQFVIGKMTTAKQGMLGLIMYAQDHAGQVPTNFDQITSFFNDPDMAQDLTNNFEIVFQGISQTLTPAQAIVIRQAQPLQTSSGKWGKVYGFADGHSEFHVEASGDFTAFEQQHGVAPSGQ